MMYKRTKLSLAVAMLLIITYASNAATSEIILTNVCEPLTTLNINGAQISRLLIDSGASGGIHLKEGVINKLPGNPAKFIKKSESIDLYGKIRQSKNYLAPRVMINNVQMKNISLTIFERWGGMEVRQKIVPINGVIGLDAFGDSILIIDLDNMTFEVADSVKLDDQKNGRHCLLREPTTV